MVEIASVYRAILNNGLSGDTLPASISRDFLAGALNRFVFADNTFLRVLDIQEKERACQM